MQAVELQEHGQRHRRVEIRLMTSTLHLPHRLQATHWEVETAGMAALEDFTDHLYIRRLHNLLVVVFCEDISITC
jgi:hypothetical protein